MILIKNRFPDARNDGLMLFDGRGCRFGSCTVEDKERPTFRELLVFISRLRLMAITLNPFINLVSIEPYRPTEAEKRYLLLANKTVNSVYSQIQLLGYVSNREFRKWRIRQFHGKKTLLSVYVSTNIGVFAIFVKHFFYFFYDFCCFFY